ncbi:MAG TPA: wax ester/triacylglycerol synthase family O-acyltransferase, partial [Candidatus Solibacter sp.]|nr:wax ester/triacylglycerol synthase family O-acyltransferase [Candidatus Solibacter sp.]
MKAQNLNRRLSGVDSAFLYLERKEIPLHIAAVCIFESALPFAEFVRSIDSKLHLVPRYRQLAVDSPFHLGYPTWEDDPKFDIRRHIFKARVEAPGGQAEMEALASRVLSQVMDRGKPLWDIHVVEGLRDGQGAIIVRIHHALADGVAGAALFKIMFDATPGGSHPGPKQHFHPTPAPESNHSVVDAITSAVHSSLQSVIAMESVLLDFARTLMDDRTKDAMQKLVALLPELGASSERFVFNKPCTGARKFCWTEFPFADAQAVREAAGGTVNDIVLTVVTRAISRYIQLHGEPVAGRFLRVVCPVSVRRDEQQQSLGNQITFMPVALPLDIEDPIRMLQAVAERTEIMKNARAAHLVALLSTWLGAAPPPLQALFWGTLPLVNLPMPLFNMICTNVPGSPTALYAVGRKMIASYPHVPTGYELGVNFAVQSYDGKLCCGFTADADVVPDAERLRDMTYEAFRDLLHAAVPRKASGRRRPSGKRKPAKSRPAEAAPVPAVGGKPAPAVGGKPVPAVGGKPAPAVGGKPAPAVGGKPVPAGRSRPVAKHRPGGGFSAVGGRPVPAVGGKPAPAVGGRPVPTVGGEPAPVVGGAPAPAPADESLAEF